MVTTGSPPDNSTFGVGRRPAGSFRVLTRQSSSSGLDPHSTCSPGRVRRSRMGSASVYFGPEEPGVVMELSVNRPPHDPELRAILAHHEAGHVVADFIGGVRVSRVSIDQAWGGVTVVEGLEEPDLEALTGEALTGVLEPAVVGLLAGPLAEEALTGLYDTDRAVADLESAGRLGFASVPDGVSWSDYDDELTGRARRIVADYWPIIVDLAAELVLQGEMNGEDVVRFLEPRCGSRCAD